MLFDPGENSSALTRSSMAAVTARAASAVSFQQTMTVPRSGSRVVKGAISKGLPQPGSSLVDVTGRRIVLVLQSHRPLVITPEGCFDPFRTIVSLETDPGQNLSRLGRQGE